MGLLIVQLCPVSLLGKRVFVHVSEGCGGRSLRVRISASLLSIPSVLIDRLVREVYNLSVPGWSCSKTPGSIPPEPRPVY